jgi:hypothetical protein
MERGKMASEISELRKELIAQAWRLDDSGKHTKAYPPDVSKPMVTISKTPGGGRWLQNTISQLRKSGFVSKGR